MTLIEKLLEAGYPASDIYHHERDLYILDTELTRSVLIQFCNENVWENLAHAIEKKLYLTEFVVTSFRDEITGKMMLDCFGQYYEMEDK